MSNILIIAAITALMFVVGILLGIFFGYPFLGAITGLLAGLSLSAYWITRRRRWLATIILLTLFALAYVTGGWLGTMYAAAVSGLTLFTSAAILREFYGGNEFEAFFHHLRLLVGFIRGIQVIADGSIVAPSASRSELGPFLIVVGPENAIIMQRGPQQTRISGPAVFTSAPFEYVKRVYDLRPRQKTFTFQDVLTSDLMATTVTVSVTYGIKIPPRIRHGQASWTDAETRVIERIDSWMTDWETRTAETIEGSVRQAVGRLDLATLLTPGYFADLARQIQILAIRTLRPWGVNIHQVIVSSVQPANGVKTATTNRWIASAELQTTITIERARALAWKEALLLLADGYAIAKQKGMSEESIHREVLRRTLEQIAKDPATKIIFTPELNSALAGLFRSIGLISDAS
ncbi:MAG: hypothetical protein H5T68_04715 [Chloroflexi bacterium]|nr:hypothetical protein [Chloroflexota bacterium]